MSDDDSADPDSRGGRYSPLGIDVTENIRKSEASLQKLKSKIAKMDKEFMSKTDSVRRDLYLGLKKYFRVYKNDYKRFNMFVKGISDEEFERFLLPRAGLEKLPSWDLKHKIQKLILKLEHDYAEDRTCLYSTICYCDVIYASKAPSKLKWTTYRLLGTVEENNQHNITAQSCKKFVKTAKQKLGSALDSLEDELFDAFEPSRACFLVHSSASDDEIGFLCIRKQTEPNEESVRKKRKNVFKQSSETMLVAMKQEVPHFFVSGAIADEQERIIEMIANSLGYQSAEMQNLTGTDISLLISLCERKTAYPPRDVFEKEFQKEKAERKKDGHSWADPTAELHRRYQSAAYKGDDDTSNEIKRTQTFTFSATNATTKYTFKGTPSEIDEQIIELYNNGFIKDLAPFMTLKNTQSNIFHEN